MIIDLKLLPRGSFQATSQEGNPNIIYGLLREGE